MCVLLARNGPRSFAYATRENSPARTTSSRSDGSLSVLAQSATCSGIRFVNKQLFTAIIAAMNWIIQAAKTRCLPAIEMHAEIKEFPPMQIECSLREPTEWPSDQSTPSLEALLPSTSQRRQRRKLSIRKNGVLPIELLLTPTSRYTMLSTSANEIHMT